MLLRRGAGAVAAAGLAVAASSSAASASASASSSSSDSPSQRRITELENQIRELEKQAKDLPVPHPTLQEKDHILKTTKKTVAVFGGSFDPITNAHLTSACEILHHRKADEVWLVPCGARPDKPSLKTPASHRLIMCHLAVNSSFGSKFPMKVDDIETRNGGVALSTYDLMTRLQAQHPEFNFVFVVGSDLIGSMRSWTDPVIKNHGELLWNELSFLGLVRPGYSGDFEELPPKFRWIHDKDSSIKMVTQELSSSEIRARMNTDVGQGERDRAFGEFERSNIQSRNMSKIEGLMPAAVLAHILRNDLYQD